MHIEELLEQQQAELQRRAKLTDRLMCCTAAGCASSGSLELKKAVEAEIKAQHLEGTVECCGTGCLGLCSRGPLVKSAATGRLYGNVSLSDAPALVQGAAGGAGPCHLEIDTALPFFARQYKVVLSGSGMLDPERIDDYVAQGGYQALATALSEMSPRDVIEQIKQSGLRGRGGAGYPTGLKWELVAKQPSDTKYIVCNADEGDPGAFMDRSVLEGDPHRVLEGMAIAGYATGAQQGFIYVRGEYALAIQRLQTAIRQAERERLLGSRTEQPCDEQGGRGGRDALRLAAAARGRNVEPCRGRDPLLRPLPVVLDARNGTDVNDCRGENERWANNSARRALMEPGATPWHSRIGTLTDNTASPAATTNTLNAGLGGFIE